MRKVRSRASQNVPICVSRNPQPRAPLRAARRPTAHGRRVKAKRPIVRVDRHVSVAVCGSARLRAQGYTSRGLISTAMQGAHWPRTCRDDDREVRSFSVLDAACTRLHALASCARPMPPMHGPCMAYEGLVCRSHPSKPIPNSPLSMRIAAPYSSAQRLSAMRLHTSQDAPKFMITCRAKTKQQRADEKQAMWETQQSILENRRSGKYMEAVRERKRKAREVRHLPPHRRMALPALSACQRLHLPRCDQHHLCRRLAANQTNVQTRKLSSSVQLHVPAATTTPMYMLQEKLKAARAQKDGPASGEAMWSRQQQILNDRRGGKMVDMDSVDKRRSRFATKDKKRS